MWQGNAVLCDQGRVTQFWVEGGDGGLWIDKWFGLRVTWFYCCVLPVTLPLHFSFPLPSYCVLCSKY